MLGQAIRSKERLLDRKTLFIRTITTLESAGIATCILHGYERYPDHIPSDVDFIVDTQDICRIGTVIKKNESTIGAQLVQVIQHEATCYFYILACPNAGRDITFLQLDAASDYRRNGRIFFRAREFLDSRRQFNGFWVPPPHMEFAYYLVKKVAKGRLEQNQAKYLSQLYHKDPKGCWQQLYRFWPAASAERLARAAQSGDWSQIQDNIARFRRDLLRETALKEPVEVIKYWWGELRRWVKRWFRPTGLHVIFLGPDGSGKSSVIAEMEKKLAPAFRRTARMHLRPYLLGAKKNGRMPVTDPHDHPPYGLLKSVVKLLYLLFDYTAGFLQRVYPKLARSTLVLFDRYYYDLLVDWRRYRYGGPLWLARLVSRFVPRPDLIILLDAPADVLWERKKEVRFEELIRQREDYLKLVQNLPNGYIIDASRLLNEVVSEVERIILNYLAERTTRRLKLQRWAKI